MPHSFVQLGCWRLFCLLRSVPCQSSTEGSRHLIEDKTLAWIFGSDCGQLGDLGQLTRLLCASVFPSTKCSGGRVTGRTKWTAESVAQWAPGTW